MSENNILTILHTGTILITGVKRANCYSASKMWCRGSHLSGARGTSSRFEILAKPIQKILSNAIPVNEYTRGHINSNGKAHN